MSDRASRPRIMTWPESGGRSPVAIFSMVVFPAPLGPTNP